MIENYFPILIVLIVAAGFAIFSLILTHLVGPRVTNAVKMMPYESGVDQVGKTRIRFSIRFFLIPRTGPSLAGLFIYYGPSHPP